MFLQEKLKNLPSSPGVYLMKDSQSTIIYVGKAKNLKNRVKSYFQKSKNHSPKVKRLVQHLKDFEYILTDTELEAFLLECKLIKEMKPMYNRMMKNPKSFCYIVIRMKEEYRRIEITNSPNKNDGNLYYGPFPNKNTVDKAIQGIKESFKINCCQSSHQNSPCLNYSLGLCIGICLGGKAVVEYHAIMNKIISLLNGSDVSLLDEMTQMMHYASEDFDFERAAKLRDYIDSVHSLINKERVIEFTEENNNMIIIEYLSKSLIKLFLIKRTEVLFREKYNIESSEQLIPIISSNIFTYFSKNTPQSSKEVSRTEIDEAQIIYSYLKSHPFSYVIIPEKWLNDHEDEKMNDALYTLLSCNSKLV